ncbi:MAG TPA: hypothetical protein VFY84_04880 [Jiangellales bacterium]|nr:hypothetical protein [Jiangellales bacterium]
MDPGICGARWAAGPPATGQPRYAEQSHLLRVTLFEPPEGWEIREGSLTSLAPGVPYGLSFDSLQGQRSRIRFTLDQLERLDDKVRTGPWSDEQTMSENHFVKAARADCDKQRNDPGDARG